MHSENPKPVVSVLLPIGRTFDRVFSDAILPCATELRMQTARVSTEFSSAGALARVHEQIQSSELIVADLTGRNPNVLYLVGYAHAAGKKVIFLSQHGEDLPFCRAEHAIIIYAGSTSELAAELRITIQQLGGETPAPVGEDANAATIKDARKEFLSIFGTLLSEYGYEHRGGIRMENEKTFVLENQEMDLALVQALARRARELGIRLKLL